MDALLARFGAQAMNLAIRSGIVLTSNYAIGQCSRLLKTVDDKSVRTELKTLQKLLNSKIKIISPAIDLIELKSGRGNVVLESAVPLAKDLHGDIVALGRRLESAAGAEEHSRLSGTTPTTAEARHAELKRIISDIKSLLARIDHDIQYLQLAITASGESLSSSLPQGISPSRFLQASAFLNIGDTQFASDSTRPVQIGPSFFLSLYMLFLGHTTQPARHNTAEPATPVTPDPSGAGTPRNDEPYGFEEGERRPIWQEILHKARVRLCRTPPGWAFDHNEGYVPKMAECRRLDGASMPELGQLDEYSYHLEIVEDLNDGRLHDLDEPIVSRCAPYDDITEAGIRESIPIHQISKIFYTNTGRLLNIGNSDEAGNTPILLLKRDADAATPTEMTGQIMATRTNDDLAKITDGRSVDSDEQDDVDRQLWDESEIPETSSGSKSHPLGLHLPSHLDPEWLALQVYREDDEDDSSASEDEQDDESDGEDKAIAAMKPKAQPPSQRSSLDAKLLAQIKNISIRDPDDPRVISRQSSGRHLDTTNVDNAESFVARSPFGSITSSLSLMEMLIRLTSLQEFQQAAHLSIPDHILTFFLEETSTTGLNGEERWKARQQAKRRVGFDPYTDTPSK